MKNLREFQENLEQILAEYASGDREFTSTFTRADFLEYSKINLAYKYLIEKGVETLEFNDNGAMLESLNAGEADCVIAYAHESVILNRLNQMMESAKAFESITSASEESTRKEKTLAKKETEKVVREALVIAREILPDYLKNVHYALINVNEETVIYDEHDNYVVDIDRMFKGISKSAKISPVFSVRTLTDKSSREYAKFNAKLKQIVQEDAEEFMAMIPAIDSKMFSMFEKGKYNAEFARVASLKPEALKINSGVRAFRRANRPVDKKGNFFPSYLDYITDNQTSNRKFSAVTFEEFKETPTFKVFAPFETEEEFNEFVKSREFAEIVSYLETPRKLISAVNYDDYVKTTEEGITNKTEKQLEAYNKAKEDEFSEWKNSVMELEFNGTEYRVKEDEGSDFKTADEIAFTSVGYFAKEDLVLPSKVYKKAKKASKGNPTVEVSKQQNEKVLAFARRLGAGVLALTVLVNSIGWAVDESVESIEDLIDALKKKFEQIGKDDQPNKPPVSEDETTGQDEPVVEPETSEIEVETKGSEDEIKDNPNDEILDKPNVEHDTDGNVKPNLPEEETTLPEDTTEQNPEDTTEEVTDSKPEYDQPDAPVQEENGIVDDRKDENDDDEFFID